FARNLASGYGYVWEPGIPTAFWPVGTSFLFSLLYRLFGFDFGPIVVMNVILGVGIVAAVMILARRWFGDSISVMAGLIVALWPTLVEFTTIPASELPFIFLVLGAWVAMSDEFRPILPVAIIGGLFLAAASFVRPTALGLLPVLAIPRAFRRRDWTRQLLKV